MFGIVHYLFFISLGIEAAGRVWGDKPLLYRVWLGAVFGTVAHIWLPGAWAFAFSFGIAAHIAAAVTAFGLWAVVFFWRRRVPRAPFDSGQRRDLGVLAAWAGPLLILIAVLFVNHVLVPKGGGWWGGQSTFGDLSMHMGMITSIAYQGTWPPQYSIFPGHLLCYPFLADSQSASFLLLGLPLRWAIVFPSIALAALCLGGVWLFVYDYTGRRGVAALSGLLFFLNGGLGFLLMLDGAGQPDSLFRQIFTGFYQTPTNYLDLNLRWTNVICDMLIPQRTTLLGFAMLPAALYLAHSGCARGERRDLIAGAVLAGCLPMMHTHTFLALGIVCFGWAIAYIPKREDRPAYFMRWWLYLMIVAVMALPQLLFWTFRQSRGEDFVRIHIDWVNDTDPWLWFWIKNVGLPFVLLFPALWAAKSKGWRWYAGALLIFVLAEFVAFQPNEYDNNKLLLVWYLFTAVIVAQYLAGIWRRLGKMRGRYILAGVLGVVLFASALLTVGREMASGGQYQLYDGDAVAAAEFIMEETPPDAVFATWDQHLNPVCAIAGRNVYVGSPAYLFFHGLEFWPRQEQMRRIFTDWEAMVTLPGEIGIDYIYVSPYERGYFQIPDGWFAGIYPLAYRNGSIEIYAVSERARAGLK